jgi:hypothetical protein
MLADQAALYRFSIGDIFLIAGFLMFLMGLAWRAHLTTHQERSRVEHPD